jgi:2-polyprenyl-3-methyl-5-hydroxy-6-metoxy-1,4-benzoquinol methylase
MMELTNEDAIQAWSSMPRQIMENFGDEGDFIRQHLLNPAIFSLLGDVTDKTVLDAGCGQGYLSRLLTRKGAIVTGIEPATQGYTYALQREQTESLGITYLQEDLSAWKPVLNTFDYVIANMVFMDIPDYLSALYNCIAALKNNGKLIFSLLHPCFEEPGSEWQKKGYVEVRDYCQERVVKQTYGHFIHRPLSTYLNSVIQAGCTIQNVIEPQLDRNIAQQHHTERYWHVPGYIVICAMKSV